ncbi:hypothetical protein [uncultured Actinomyces sp.]|uniref:hypothetical protein n=1 Tax=uncultured Actinomyces sp. TaxID=249061 RepID=UPI0028E7E28D|nr:hypothetical protein [uncultured Actinomyces sp.]
MTRRSIILAILVILVPALAGFMVVSAATAPKAKAASIPAAVVNLDSPATTSDGTTMPAGRLLLGRLTNPDAALTASSSTGATTDTLDYSVVTADAAAQGLSDGTYDVVITIPEGFSQAVVDTLGGTPSDATVDVQTNGTASPEVGAASQEIVSAAAASLGTTVSVAYLNASLTSLSDMKDQLGRAAGGADRLSTGADSLESGADDLSTGADQASQGATTLADGLNRLESGADELTDGTSSASSGAADLSDGASSLSSGASTLADGADSVDSGASSLSSGASTLADGAATVDSGASTLATGTSNLSTGVDSYVTGVTGARDALTVPQNGAAASLVDGAAQLAGGVDSYTSGVDQLHQRLTATDPATGTNLVTGASSLADGANRLEGGIDSYTSGVDTLASQANQAGTGLETAYRQCVSDHGEQDATCQYLAASTAGMGRSTDVYDPATGANTDGSRATMLGVLNTLSSTAPGSPRAGLTSGASEVATGASGLSKAIGTDPSSTDPTTVVGALGALSDQSEALSDAASAVSTGLGGSTDVYDPTDPSSATLAGVLNTLVSQGSNLTAGASNLSSGASTLSGGASTLSSSASTLSSGASSLSGGTSRLSTGANSLSNGASTLADGTSQLSSGASSLSTGATRLSGGADALSQGLSRLETGASSLAAGTTSAADGATTLSDGVSSLSSGATQLSDGASTLSTGADDLSTGLSTAEDSVPSYTDQQAADLAAALAQPVSVDTSAAGSARPETSAAPAAIAIASWIGALVVVSGLGLMTRRRVEAPMSPARLAGASLKPAVGLALVQAPVLIGVVVLAGARTGSVGPAVLLTAVGAVAMTVLHAALMAVFGPRGGAAVSLLALVAQGVLVLGGSAARASGALLVAPVGVLHSALSGLMLGTVGEGVSAATAVLLAWAAASALAMTLAVRRRRSTSVEALRRELAEPQGA